MLGHEKRQLGFANIQSLQAWLIGDLVPKNSIYHALSQANDVFRDDLFADAYSPIGRPSTPPSRLMKAMLLQHLENVSDREAENRARYDLRWKVALGTNLEEAGFDYCSLSFFRTRLLLKDSFRVVFKAVLNAAVAHYTSQLYSNLLKKHGILQSMSRRASPLDNAPIESFFGHLKCEAIYPAGLRSIEEVPAAIDQYIDFYNNERPHSRHKRKSAHRNLQ